MTSKLNPLKILKFVGSIIDVKALDWNSYLKTNFLFLCNFKTLSVVAVARASAEKILGGDHKIRASTNQRWSARGRLWP